MNRKEQSDLQTKFEERKIKEKIEEYLSGETRCSITVSLHGDTLTVNLEQDYEGAASNVKFKHLNWLSKLLETDEINLENDHFSGGGCDTCGYGSYSSVDIVCYNVNFSD